MPLIFLPCSLNWVVFFFFPHSLLFSSFDFLPRWISCCFCFSRFVPLLNLSRFLPLWFYAVLYLSLFALLNISRFLSLYYSMLYLSFCALLNLRFLIPLPNLHRFPVSSYDSKASWETRRLIQGVCIRSLFFFSLTLTFPTFVLICGKTCCRLLVCAAVDLSENRTLKTFRQAWR